MKVRLSPEQREILRMLCLPRQDGPFGRSGAELEEFTHLEPRVIAGSLRALQKQGLVAYDGEWHLTDEGYARAYRIGGIRGCFGYVRIVAGRHAGKFGWYEEDASDRHAVVLVPDGRTWAREEGLRILGQAEQHGLLGLVATIPFTSLRLFEDQETYAAAASRFSPREAAAIGNASEQAIELMVDLFMELGISNNMFEEDMADLRNILHRAGLLKPGPPMPEA